MSTELTQLRDSDWLQGWVLYDAACPSCRRFARLTEDLLTRRGFDLAPLQSLWVGECLTELGPRSLSALLVVTVDGRCFAGADALIFLAGRIWWAFPLVGLALIPGVRSLLRQAYGYYASQRCTDQCQQLTT